MPYKVAKMLEGIWTVRNDEGSVVLKCKPPYAGPPPERTEAAAGGDWTYTLDVARKAVRYARRVLPKGAFNNQMRIGGQWRYLTGKDAPKVWAARVETMFAELAYPNDQEKDFITQMAARSLATRTVGGGVCSMLTYVTAGWLTMNAKRGTKIATVFDDQFNHEYCVVYYGLSPWVVADPWVGTSYCCDWRDCYFPREAIAVTTLTEVGVPVSVPFGVEFEDGVVQAARRKARVDEPVGARDQLPAPHQDLAYKDRYPWFHMDGAYGHPDNVAEGKHAKYDVAAKPDEWGDAVVD